MVKSLNAELRQIAKHSEKVRHATKGFFMKHLTLAVFLVVATTTVLSADCGWILWTNQDARVAGWTFLTPWPDQATCQKEQEAEIGRWIKQGWQRYPKLGPQWIVRQLTPDGTALVNLDGTRRCRVSPRSHTNSGKAGEQPRRHRAE